MSRPSPIIALLLSALVLVSACAVRPSIITPGASSTAIRAAAATEAPTAVPAVAAPTPSGRPAYQDSSLAPEARAADLLARMTLAEKIGQMTQVEKSSIKPGDVAARAIGSVLSGGGGYPQLNTSAAWLKMVNGFQEEALTTRLGIPLIYGADAVHGHNNVRGATIFPHPMADANQLGTVGSDAHRQLAREAVRKSLVLLKNDHQAIPLGKNVSTIFVAGEAANDIGIQCGGWTIEWQGTSGNITSGTMILDGIKKAVAPETKIQFDRSGSFAEATDPSGNPIVADVGIAVVGEKPYAKGVGDRADSSLSDADASTINRLRERSRILVVVLLSGRPMIITEQLAQADAFVAAWLPGTEGGGVADMLFGDFPFAGRLSYTWPRSMAQLPFDFANPASGENGPLFAFGYGLDVADGGTGKPAANTTGTATE